MCFEMDGLSQIIEKTFELGGPAVELDRKFTEKVLPFVLLVPAVCGFQQSYGIKCTRFP